MKKEAAATQGSQSETPRSKSGTASKCQIHPVVIYPFTQPGDYSDLGELYELIGRLDAEKGQFARPITVIDRKTHFAMEGNKSFLDFRKNIVAKHSDILDAWSVDTCQMWYSGLGMACEKGGPGDVYWLIPGDFNYGSGIGKEVLGRLHELPKVILEKQHDFCVGAIATDHNNPKQLIDTYGTFALLYNWFPAEAQEIRKITERPRSEFFAIGHSFLREALRQRWYAYEQTMVLLLSAVFSRKQVSEFSVGDISDLPQGRESLASAVQQVERTERVLKTVWLEWNQPKPGWAERYHVLESQSNHVRRTSLLILQNAMS
jgi:hypothetical protein